MVLQSGGAYLNHQQDEPANRLIASIVPSAQVHLVVSPLQGLTLLLLGLGRGRT